MTLPLRALLALFALSLAPGLARAAPPTHADGHVHDWLLWWPPCAQADLLGAPGPGEDRLLYPRPGLPAVLRAGERLTTRVHLAAPLTPPPGVQQERALRGWSATLYGRAALEAPSPAEHRYALRVDDVRVDAQGGPVYRASVDVPPWVAPGTYDLVLQVPGRGRELAAVASVRVITGPTPTLRSLPEGADPGALRFADVDVWVAPRGEVDDRLRRPLRGHGLPWLDASLASLLLQVGEGAMLARPPGCDDPALPYASVLAGLRGRALEDAELVEPAGTGIAVGVEQGETAHAWQVTAQGHGARVSVLLPERPAHRVEVEGGAIVGAWPATPVRPAGHRPGILVWVEVPAGRVAQLRAIAVEPPAVALAGETVARSDRPSRFELTSAEPFDDVALGWEERGAAYGPADQPPAVRFRWMERQELHALALRRDGVSARASHAVFVHPRRPSACHAAGGGGAGNWWIFAALCTIAARRYTCPRRPRLRFGSSPRFREATHPPRTFAPRP